MSVTNADPETLLAIPTCPECHKDGDWRTEYEEVGYVSYPALGITPDGIVGEDENAGRRSDEAAFFPEVLNAAPKLRVLRCEECDAPFTYELVGGAVILTPADPVAASFDRD